uniref:Uncharacterized protein n=1 Tax=Romanomermis culicivorax TaxID=13658 RepID=A0A915IPZ8_ROMCU
MAHVHVLVYLGQKQKRHPGTNGMHQYELVKSDPIIWRGCESIEHNCVSGRKAKLDESCDPPKMLTNHHSSASMTLMA